MPAQVIPLHRAPPHRWFDSFLDVSRYMIFPPEDALPGGTLRAFDEDDAAKLLEFFQWFGVEVDIDGSLDSLVEGWSYLMKSVGQMGSMRLRWPPTYEALYGRLPQEEQDYVTAVIAGDYARAKVLVRRTPHWGALREAMQTAEGSALLQG